MILKKVGSLGKRNLGFLHGIKKEKKRKEKHIRSINCTR